MAISMSSTHQQLKRERASNAGRHGARQLENNRPPIEYFAPKNAALILLLTRFLVNRLVFRPAETGCSAHCQSPLSGFGRPDGCETLTVLEGSITAILTLRSISVRRSTRDKSPD
jgi:hypothetical protein